MECEHEIPYYEIDESTNKIIGGHCCKCREFIES